MKVDVVLHRSYEPDKLCFDLPDDIAVKEIIKRLLVDCRDKYNDFVRLSLQKPYKKRTQGPNSQNSCIHGYAQQIANYIGDDVETVKTYCKHKAISRGYPVITDSEGNVIISRLTDKPIPESSAKVSIVEAGYLIDSLQQLAAELGITLIDGGCR